MSTFAVSAEVLNFLNRSRRSPNSVDVPFLFYQLQGYHPSTRRFVVSFVKCFQLSFEKLQGLMKFRKEDDCTGITLCECLWL